MDFTPLLSAPMSIQIHALAAFSALALTPVMLMRRKGDRLHKSLGRVWVAAMAFTALSSFAIHEIRLVGPFSPIHILSVFTLYTLIAAITSARAGRIKAHKQNMLGAMAGLIGAGLFTLLPGRVMSQVVFKGFEVPGFAGAMLLGGAALIMWRRTLLREKA